MVTLDQIRERLKYLQKWITTIGTTDLFSSNVPEKAMRYVVAVFLQAKDTTAVVSIKKKTEAGAYEVIFPEVNVAVSEIKAIPPQGYNLEHPVIALEGGTNLAAELVSGTSASVTVIYWDSEVL